MSKSTFLKLLREQLGKDMDRDCKPLGLQGSRGALFKITLSSHGYTFVEKGTVLAFVRDSDHEANVYRHLHTLQGSCIPVFMGTIDLIHPYYLDIGVEIIRFLLMSRAGESMKLHPNPCREYEVHPEARRSEKVLRALGVEHCDLRPPNVLLDPRDQTLMLIDFERSQFLQE